jgi:hypothetical protein
MHNRNLIGEMAAAQTTRLDKGKEQLSAFSGELMKQNELVLKSAESIMAAVNSMVGLIC